ncbi:MAG TPA: sulfotransferase domain-containing protein, partial [Candidatus Binatia bacterium]|nr:sulfotransferase domain-containing protein [Candidatus Binatia bacterium]
SGNTWVRIFLNNYLLDGDAPADINDLEEGLHAGSRTLFDRLTGLESSDLTPAEIDSIRPLMYVQWAQESDEPLFVKVHDAWRRNDRGQPIFPAAATALVVYIVRNPLDIVASLANHYAMSCDEAIAMMADDQYGLALSSSQLRHQLPQRLRSWHAHVRSWLDESGLPMHLVRYEDMLASPQETFGRLVTAVGLTLDVGQLARALDYSSFRTLQAQEKAHGFNERLGGGPFFRRGQAGSWRKELSAWQAAQVIKYHGPPMRRFGYL